MGNTPSAALAGEGGCFSVKCRSEPLQVYDKAVLRVTKDEARGPARCRCRAGLWPPACGPQ